MIKKIGVFSLTLLVLGCGSTASNYNSYKKPATNQSKTGSAVVKPQNAKVSLTVSSNPKEARIRILNIGPKYQDGILLKKGKYHIEVSKSGFQTHKKWYDVSESKNLKISLEKNYTVNVERGRFHWNDYDVNREFENLYFVNGLVWSLNFKDRLTSSNALSYCRSLTQKENGFQLNNFRLPTLKEAISSFPSGKRIPEYLESKIGGSRNWSWTSTLRNKADLKKEPRWRDYYTAYIGSKGASSNGYYSDMNHYKLKALCVSNGNNLTLNELASIFYKNAQADLQNVKIPIRPTKQKAEKLTKGEFESTKEFSERRKINKLKSEKDYAKKITSWKNTVANIKQKNKEAIKVFKENKTSNMMIAYQKAMQIKYGSPKIESAVYNADSESFEVKLNSSYGNYNKKVNIPVSRKYAKQFKEILNKKGFKPTVNYIISNNNVSFERIEEIVDPSQLVIDTAYRNTKNTTASLREFINKYPESQYVSDAQSRIAEIVRKENELRREQEEWRLANKLKREKENKERKIAQAKAEREFVILGSCNVGDTVYHRERWNTTTSSGNIIADGLFGAATKEQFIIIYEGVVKGFVGEKVEVVINDYGVKQTIGGGFLQPQTWRKYELGKHADKYLGKTQFYEKARCN